MEKKKLGWFDTCQIITHNVFFFFRFIGYNTIELVFPSVSICLLLSYLYNNHFGYY